MKTVTDIFQLTRAGDRRGVKRLLEKQPDLINAIDSKGCTPLLCACSHGHMKIVVMLAEKDANINVYDKNLRTALHYACAFGRLDVAQLLASRGANLNVQEKNGWTPFHLACDTGSKEVATLLAESGADVNARDNHGYTALHYACAYSRLEMAVMLVELGSDITVRENEGRTALELATDDGLLAETLEALKRRGKDLAVLENLRHKLASSQAPVPAASSSISGYSTVHSTGTNTDSESSRDRGGSGDGSSALTYNHGSNGSGGGGGGGASNQSSSSRGRLLALDTNSASANSSLSSLQSQAASVSSRGVSRSGSKDLDREEDNKKEAVSSYPKLRVSIEGQTPPPLLRTGSAPVIVNNQPTSPSSPAQSHHTPSSGMTALSPSPSPAPAPQPDSTSLAPSGPPSPLRRGKSLALMTPSPGAGSPSKPPPVPQSHLAQQSPQPLPQQMQPHVSSVQQPLSYIPQHLQQHPHINQQQQQQQQQHHYQINQQSQSQSHSQSSPQLQDGMHSSSYSFQSPPLAEKPRVVSMPLSSSRQSMPPTYSSRQSMPSSRQSSFYSDSGMEREEEVEQFSFADSLYSAAPISKPPASSLPTVGTVLISKFEIESATSNYSHELLLTSSQFNSYSNSMHGDSSRQSLAGPSFLSGLYMMSNYKGLFRGNKVVARRYHSGQFGNTSGDNMSVSVSGIPVPSGINLVTIMHRMLKELHILTASTHDNLLPAVAACLDPASPAILYPLCEWGSLQDVLNARKSRGFSATTRLRIALDICSALAYLHTVQDHHGKFWIVVHRNVRPVKILLSGHDASFARLSGLDMSVIVSEDQDCGSLASFDADNANPLSQHDGLGIIAGTMAGYLDPLFNETGEINVHSDVYSFGVVLLQLVTGACAATDPTLRPPGLVARARNQIKSGLRVAEEGIWSDAIERDLLNLTFRSLSLSTNERPADCSVLLVLLKSLLSVSNSSSR